MQDFNKKKPECSRHIFENTQTPNFMKIRPVGAQLFHSDGQEAKSRLFFPQLCEHA